MRHFISLGLLFISAAANAVTYNIAALESLGSSGDSTAYGLNDNGDVVGQSYNSNTQQLESVIWTGGTVQSLGVTGIARAVNNSGVVVGETGSGNIAFPSGIAYSWTSGGGINDLGSLGGDLAGAYDINEDGVITGFSYIAGQTVSTFSQGFIYENGSMTSLGTVSSPTGYSRGHGINDINEIAGRASLVDFGGSDKQLAYWESDGTLNSYPAPGNYSTAQDISNNGLIVGTARMDGSNDRFAANWDTDGNLVFMDTFGGNLSAAYGTNEAGVIVGYSRAANSSGDERAFVSYDGVSIVDLNTIVDLSGTDFIKLDEAYDINASGQIVGIGTRLDGSQGAFILTAVPVPAAVWLFGSALGALGWMRRRRT